MKDILVEIQDSIAIISLNRPEKKNALNISLLESISDAMLKLHNNKEIRVVIIKGEGTSFCSGLDLKEASDVSTIKQANLALAHVLTSIYKSPLLTIAAVHGAAMAGGAGLMSACDFAVAAKNTIFGYPEVKKGLVAAQVMVLLKAKLKERDLKELLLLGEVIQAERALSIGLITWIVEEKLLMQEAMSIAKSSLSGGKKAIAKSKELLDGLTGNFDADLKKAVIEGEKIRMSQEAKDGIKAYLKNH